MTVSLIQWRVVIGIFNCQFLGLSKNCSLSRNFTTIFEMAFICYHYFRGAYFFINILYIYCMLHCYGGIELNPGPRKLKGNTFSIYHWILKTYSVKDVYFNLQT